MKYIAKINARPVEEEPIEMRHLKFFRELVEVPPPWGMQGHEIPPTPDPGADLGCGVTVSRWLGKGIGGEAYYQFRREFRDRAAEDDFFDMTFNPKRVPYRELVHDVMPRLIGAFDAYRAAIFDDRFIDIDWEQEANRVNKRFKIYRVAMVSFFDALLCRRAFDRTPEEIVARTEPHVERAELMHGGVYLVGTSEPLPTEEADALCWKMKDWILGT